MAPRIVTHCLLFIIFSSSIKFSHCYVSSLIINIDQILDTVLEENRAKYNGQNNDDHYRDKRSDKAGIHMKTKQTADLPICGNMKGILGNYYFLNVNNLFDKHASI
jgi:hypothetical protein